MATKKEESKKNTSKKSTASKKVAVKKENTVAKKVPVEKNKKEKEIKKETPKKENKKNTNEKVMKFFDFVDKYRLAIYGVVGGVLATVLVVILIWPDRIAKLENGLEPVASIKDYTITAEDLYEDMKEIYSISSLLDKIDNKILVEKYPEDDEMNTKVEENAKYYYNMYEQYYGQDKETFLANNGFGSERAFLEYLKLAYRRNKYAEDYAKTLVSEDEVNKYYEDKVYGDINTKHILVNVDSSASEEDKTKAKELAEEIISKLDNGATFDEVKEEYKDSITYEELGYKSYDANLEKAYMDEMKNLGNETYSKKPVETSYGYHIVYRIDQKDKLPLEEMKDEIIDHISKDKMAEDENFSYKALEKMREEAEFTFTDTVLKDKYDKYTSQYK